MNAFEESLVKAIVAIILEEKYNNGNTLRSILEIQEIAYGYGIYLHHEEVEEAILDLCWLVNKPKSKPPDTLFEDINKHTQLEYDKIRHR